MFENIENDIINNFIGLERGTKDDDFRHKDIRIILTDEWIDVKQPSKYNTISGNIAWLITVVSDTGMPGALFGEEKYVGLTNLFKQDFISETKCIDNRAPWMFLIDRKELLMLAGGLEFDYFKTIPNNCEYIKLLNKSLNLSSDYGLYFQQCNKPGTRKYFLVITENFIRTYPKQLFCRNK